MKRLLYFAFVACAVLSTSTSYSQTRVQPLVKRSMLFSLITHSSVVQDNKIRLFVRPAAGQVHPQIDVSTCPPSTVILDQPYFQSLPSMTYLMSVQYSTTCPIAGTTAWTEMQLTPLPPSGDKQSYQITFPAKNEIAGVITIIMEDGSGPGASKTIQGTPGTPTIIQNFYDCCDCEEGKKPRKPKDKSEIIDQTPIQQYFRD